MAGDLSEQIIEAVQSYTKEAAEKTKKAVDRVTEECAAEIKAHIPFNNRTGKYVGAFATKTSYENQETKRNTWYVKPPHYRLTHLLEYGHEVKDRHGVKHGRARAFPHIKYGYDLAVRRLPEAIQEELKK